MKILFKTVLALIITIPLYSGMYSPMIQAVGTKKIIDIGVRSQLEIINTTPKIWDQYQADFVAIEGVVHTRHREYSQEETCITDQFNRTGCPLLAERCRSIANYIDANISRVNSSVSKSSYCPSGTRLHISGRGHQLIGECVFNPKLKEVETEYRDHSSTNYYYYKKYTNDYFGNNYEWSKNGYYYYYDEGDATYHLLDRKPTYSCSGGNLSFAVEGYLPYQTIANYKAEGSYLNGLIVDGVVVSTGMVLPSCYKKTTIEYCERGGVLDFGNCFIPTQCDNGYTRDSWNVCRQNYSYYQYSCPDLENLHGGEYESPPISDLDCRGACPEGRSENCFCNSQTPPADICAIASYECPVDPTQPCINNSTSSSTKKPLIKHDVKGTGLSEGSFEEYLESETMANINTGIRDITGDGEYLCFQKGNGETGCISAEGCTFTGRIDSNMTNIGSIWTNSNSISAMDIEGNIYQDGITSSCTLNGSIGYKGRMEPITAFRKGNEKIEFWNSYSNEGYLGFIEMVRNVDEEDEKEGYVLDKNTPWQIQSAGFNRIETYNASTYAISSAGMTKGECIQKAQEFGFSLHPNVLGIPVDDRFSYDLVMNATGGYFNDNESVFTRTVLGRCLAGYNYDEESDACKKIEVKVTTYYYKVTRTSKSGWEALTPYDLYYYGTQGYGKVLDSMAYGAGSCLWSTDEHRNSRRLWSKYSATPGPNSCNRSATASLNLTAKKETIEVDLKPFICPPNTISRIGEVCTVPYNVNLLKKCVLIKEDAPRDFSIAQNAIKTLNTNDDFYFCSPLVCGANNSCQFASCPSEFDGQITSPQRPTPSGTDCKEEICDANLPFYKWCGKKEGCPTSHPGYNLVNGQCYKTECAEGGFDPLSGLCFKWKCPENFTETGGKCVEN